MSNYRVLVHFDPDRSVFIARAPELEHCSAEGATRAEALARVEEEMNAQIDVIREQGGAPPTTFDGSELAYSGELGVKVSRTLHRDLAWQARAEGIEMSQLLAEMLAGGLDARRQRARRQQPNQQPNQQPAAAPPPAQAGDEGGDGRGNRNPAPRRDLQQGGRFRERNDPRYHAIMEDRATFLEYVRGLEQGGGQPQGRRPPRGPRGPRGGGEGG